MKVISRIKIFRNTQTVIFLVVVIIWIFLSFNSQYFLTLSNIQSIMRQMVIQGVLGIAEMIAILTGGIDLSGGSLVALINIVMSKMLSQGISSSFIVFICIIISLMIGLSHGIMVHNFKLPPFISTLYYVYFKRSYLLNFGGEIIFIEAVYLSRVNIRWVRYSVYTLASLLVRLAGILEITRLWMGVPTTGTGYELDTITAAVLGGTSLSGAVRTVFGAFVGALIMTTKH